MISPFLVSGISEHCNETIFLTEMKGEFLVCQRRRIHVMKRFFHALTAKNNKGLGNTLRQVF